MDRVFGPRCMFAYVGTQLNRPFICSLSLSVTFSRSICHSILSSLSLCYVRIHVYTCTYIHLISVNCTIRVSPVYVRVRVCVWVCARGCVCVSLSCHSRVCVPSRAFPVFPESPRIFQREEYLEKCVLSGNSRFEYQKS